MTNANPTLPATMNAIVVSSFERGFDGAACEQRPVPTPTADQLLVRIAAAPINPSDLAFVQGQYVRKPLPIIGGFEGAGTVVAVGANLNVDQWLHQQVHVLAAEGDGTWADYMAVKPIACMPIGESISLEQGATLIVNPLTAWAMMDAARKAGVAAIVQTTAASALGQMVIKLGKRWNIKVIGIVRRADQIDDLLALGAEAVLDSTAPDFDVKLRDVCRIARAMRAFDAVGGDMTGRLLTAMPNGAHVTVYGGLSGAPSVIGIDQFIMRGKSVDGFWLTTWMPAQDRATLTNALGEIMSLIGDDFGSQIRARYPLEDVAVALNDYSGQMSGGKVLFTP